MEVKVEAQVGQERKRFQELLALPVVRDESSLPSREKVDEGWPLDICMVGKIRPTLKGRMSRYPARA
jgi:hypothetical protein